MTIYRALVPVKTLSMAKSRLADYMPVREREMLVLDMLHHVLTVLRESALLAQIAVVSPDRRVLEQAQAWGVEAFVEEQHGHNPALHAAALRMLANETDALLTISADLPLLHVNDLSGLVAQSASYPVVLAAARDGTGTNALLLRPPLALPYLFGPHSLQRYIEAARQQGLGSTLYHSTGLALDIDTSDDLHLLRIYKQEMELDLV
ncbi:MAG: 2-phospho-L-lactate guanylyltransferase [Ktedonobacteraceae bacterium]|nr:2-phospho-L-lactate guanylyltransferase [Ktedonobacteraceae bacterium]